MSRIAQAFERARQEHRAALVVYLCAGDPDLDATVELACAAAEAGADVVELGVPFSDPTADGPVIQRASERALRSGTRLADVLVALRRIRARSEVPVVLFGYYNPFLAYGEARVAREARAAGADGFLVVDLPPEEAGGFVEQLRAQELDWIPLVAPTTPESRLQRIRELASAFLYYVSMTGVTGGKADLETAAERARELADRMGLPVAVGFGIKTPQDVRVISRHGDGAVVGSAIVAAIDEASDTVSAIEAVRERVGALRDALGKG